MQRFQVIVLLCFAAIAAAAVLAARARSPRHVPDLPAERNPATAPHQLDVLTYNVFLRAPSWMFRDGQDRRVAAMPALLTGYDVLVLQEAFSDSHRARLREWLRPAYEHCSEVLGRDRLIKEDGGVLVMSRWPILRQDQLLFGDICAGADCMADKGVLYVRFDKAGSTYHLFAIHLQNGPEHRSVREQQLRMARDFIGTQGIPADQPLVIAGDLNIDAIGDPDGYAAMLELLEAVDPPPSGGLIPTWDGKLNPLVKSTAREHIDYVLWARKHLPPTLSFTEVLPLRANGMDLSDHYAVRGHLEMPRQ